MFSPLCSPQARPSAREDFAQASRRERDSKDKGSLAMKPTIHDIARLAGVSKSTVSRLLNSSRNGDPLTREHMTAEQSFVPDRTAIQLARGTKQFIGILLPTLTWSFIAINLTTGILAAIPIRSPQHLIFLHKDTTSHDNEQKWQSLHIHLPASLSIRDSLRHRALFSLNIPVEKREHCQLFISRAVAFFAIKYERKDTNYHSVYR
jgi:transcriptional regulator with XRE-family HTH domain